MKKRVFATATFKRFVCVARSFIFRQSKKIRQQHGA